MRFLRIIWKDILRLNSLRPAVKIPGLVVVIFLVFGAWYLGAEWWMTRESTQKFPRPHTRLEEVLVFAALFLFGYIIWVVDRYRKRRNKPS